MTVLDLSAITDTLIGLVSKSWHSAPIWAELGKTGPTFTPQFTGLGPDAIRGSAGAHLSMFLYHVESDNAHESSFWTSQMMSSPGPPVRYLPFALDLYYLLSAYAEKSYIAEQEAMSVALRIFHASPIVHSPTASPPHWQLKLTMEHRSYDELSRLWQATTVPLRLSVVYRAAVVFLTPDQPDAAARPVDEVAIHVDTLEAPNGDLVTITSPP